MGRVSLGKFGLWVVIVLIHVRGYNGCFEEEKRGLLELKEFLISNCSTTADGDSLLPTSWVEHPESIDCCQWERVGCDPATGHVTELSLDNVIGNSEEHGPILCSLNVSVFVPFKELRSLNLSFNLIESLFNQEGFAKLSTLTKFEILDLSYNKLDEEKIFPSLGAFTSLKTLNLSFNDLKRHFPAHHLKLLSKFSKLRHLDLSYNKFDKDIFKILGVLPSLKFLSIANNAMGESVSNQDLTYNFSSLEALHLQGNWLSGMLPVEGLASFRHLKFLDFSNNGFFGSIPPSIPTLSSLEVLLLAHNELDGSLPIQGLPSFRHLKILDLSWNLFFGSIPPSIKALSSLEVLSLARNEFNGSLPIQGLCGLKNLKELDLSRNFFEGTLPPCLSNLRSLRLFNLWGNRFTGNLSSSLLGSLNSLEYIDLSHNRFEGLFSFSSFANHSKLEVVKIINDNVKFEVETEYTNWLPRFQLKILVLPNCNLNKLSGQIPKFILQQHKLRTLDLSQNKLEGSFPNWLLVNNTGLEFLNMRNNNFVGMFHLLSHPSMHCSEIDVSDNNLNRQIQANLGVMLPYVTYMNLSWNAFEGGIPSSFGQMSVLQVLDLSANNLSGEVPNELVRNCKYLDSLILSNNHFNGLILPDDFNNLTEISVLLLDNNKFTGSLTNVATRLTSLYYLDVSNNKMSGVISMTNLTRLGVLILRNNSFNGKFPCAMVPSEFMDVSYNSFSGSLASCSNPNLGSLSHLHLQGNKFTGLIPKALLNSSNLLTLDIRDNNFFGTIPDSITAFSELRILLVRGNQLGGLIPNQICRLNKITLMDLSYNSFTGSIPTCFSNIAFGTGQSAFSPVYLRIRTSSILADTERYESEPGAWYPDPIPNIIFKEDEVEFVTKSRTNSYKGSILDFMSGLDLSCNKLSGKIPLELGNLSGLHALNLSHNYLTGAIPKTLSNLTQVESLDLSYNSLSGNIPSELTDLSFLSSFNVAHNNLSGRLPERKAQFGTFEASSYEGNPYLCGPPLEKNCTGSSLVDSPRASSDDEEGGKWYDVDSQIFSASFVSTYLVFLLGFAAILYINPYWRRRWFYLIEEGLYSSYYFVFDALHKLFGSPYA